MPLISDTILGCAAFFFADKDNPEEGASGFLVGVPSLEDESQVHLYAVTNDHVSLHATSVSYSKNIAVEAHSLERVLLSDPLDKDLWEPHPHGDDVAVYPLGLVTGREYDFISEGQFVDAVTLEANAIGPGDDCMMIGRFVGIDHSVGNPVVRFGNIAMAPQEVHQGRNRDFLQESFLVDMRSISGFSGSPVFTFLTSLAKGAMVDLTLGSDEVARTMLEEGEWRTYMSRVWLLGIDWGHIPVEEAVLDEYGDKLSNGWRMTINAGLAGVVPAWKLSELLHHPNLEDDRRKAERAKAGNRPRGGEIDSGLRPPRVFNEVDFNDALRRATRIMPPAESDSED